MQQQAELDRRPAERRLRGTSAGRSCSWLLCRSHTASRRGARTSWRSGRPPRTAEETWTLSRIGSEPSYLLITGAAALMDHSPSGCCLFSRGGTSDCASSPAEPPELRPAQNQTVRINSDLQQSAFGSGSCVWVINKPRGPQREVLDSPGLSLRFCPASPLRGPRPRPPGTSGRDTRTAARRARAASRASPWFWSGRGAAADGHRGAEEAVPPPGPALLLYGPVKPRPPGGGRWMDGGTRTPEPL